MGDNMFDIHVLGFDCGYNIASQYVNFGMVISKKLIYWLQPSVGARYT